MALFKDTIEEVKEKVVKTVSSSKVSAAKKTLTVKESPLATRILSRPRVTEKSYALNALNQYVFVVTKEATKQSVKRAVEEAYAVEVEKVRIVKLPAKKRIMGKNIGTKSAIKKAIISVAKGQTIELFKGGM
ncbi:MAG: 50S ribosomal protein L23 [Candidatus Moraniibacteriota bacterium]